MHGSDVHVASPKLTKCEIRDMRRLYDKSYKSRSTPVSYTHLTLPTSREV